METWVRSIRYSFDNPQDAVILDIHAPKGYVATLHSVWISSNIEPFTLKVIVDGRQVDWDIQHDVIYAVLMAPWPPYLLKGEHIQFLFSLNTTGVKVKIRAMGTFIPTNKFEKIHKPFNGGS